jgi:hypothetical protein
MTMITTTNHAIVKPYKEEVGGFKTSKNISSVGFW